MRFLFIALTLLLAAPGIHAKETKKTPAEAGRKHFLLSTEVLTPLVLGTDISLTFGGHHNVGLGYMALEPGTLYKFYAYHPRYRWYRGRQAWDLFMEAGWTSLGAKISTANGNYLDTKVNGLSLGYGWAYLGKGPFTAHLLLSMLFAGVSQDKRESRTDGVPGHNDSSMAQVLAMPLAGFSVGVAF